MSALRESKGPGFISNLLFGGIRAWWLMRLGWKCEGPFPGHRINTLLVLPPDMNRGDKESHLLDHRLRYHAIWWEDLPQTSSHPEVACRNAPWNSENHRIILIEANSRWLKPSFEIAAQSGAQVQLLSLSRSHRRLRCNTPLLPGKHTERELAYVKRVHSYFH